MSSKVEFFVEMTCDSCVKSIEKSLVGQKGIENIDIQLNEKVITVDSSLPINVLQELLERTGRKVILKGSADYLAAVAVMENKADKIYGVVRFMQNDKNGKCIIDGTVDGLKHLPHSLFVYECGDLSEGCKSVGCPYEPESSDGRKSDSNLTKFEPDENGRALFRTTIDIKLSDIIGRSVVIIDGTEDKIACGIVARSASVFQNSKTICACDGISIWDENVQFKSTL